ncbi:EutP/PduV family microcompartment system protein [Clostridium perfringens]|uniref:EutP/PduV family microcompartment system protein n=1 Tax=Clostridium perfringens TaxID=1502 RepID=UPI000668B8B8|nr:EutP/PduV family microcompartment system protein [Clostridium perfringens]EGS5728126.1 EutP/PduV family microcompartment system protein [Clostridium perfringens]EGT0693141.1 EutP/PduV family microcompartment system protein [Clostridium perfringens]EGT4144608.1 EutP/PduV family microcompartment system protein [Clostridium perfringens]EHK2277979.1 EutP/PduV family microcompartment system protein [Clostridium perfringens]EHK2345405.1 EutP/PduV family microcompartment system protein [Clostridiu
MGRVIFMGKTGCGKTTLCQALNNLEIKYKKTQAIELYDNAIDTPGEYMENRGYYTALIVTAADADIIALVYDCTSEENYIAPGFASIFCKEVIGIITKINLAKDKSEIEVAEERLNLAGVSKIFKVDTVDDVGIKELFNYLNKF